MIPAWVDAQVILAATGFLLAVLAGAAGYAVGRAFNREELLSLQLMDITLRGAFDREQSKLRACEQLNRELAAALEARTLVDNARMMPPAEIS